MQFLSVLLLTFCRYLLVEFVNGEVKNMIYLYSILQVDGSEPVQLAESDICPWSSSTVKELLNKINPRMTKFDVCQFNGTCLCSFVW